MATSKIPAGWPVASAVAVLAALSLGLAPATATCEPEPATPGSCLTAEEAHSGDLVEAQTGEPAAPSDEPGPARAGDSATTQPGEAIPASAGDCGEVLPALAISAVTREEGGASWYGPGFYGLRTASGEVFRAGGRTVAHRTLPMGSIVRIENLDTGRSAVARVNDRGPFVEGRIVDCSFAVARELGFLASGVATVRVTLLDSIGAAADFAGPAFAGRYLEDCAPPFIARRGASGSMQVASRGAHPSIPSIAALGPRPGVTMREASLLPFPALLHASRCAGAWFADNRRRVELPASVRLRLHYAGMRAFLRLFAV